MIKKLRLLLVASLGKAVQCFQARLLVCNMGTVMIELKSYGCGFHHHQYYHWSLSSMQPRGSSGLAPCVPALANMSVPIS